MKTLSIIIPAFNEEGYIARTIQAVQQADSKHLAKEIIVINDGSQDNTEQILLEIERNSDNVTVISKKRNQGKGAALKSGFLKSRGDIVLIQDADQEYSPDDYPLLLEPFLSHNADVVYGSRFISDRPHRVLLYWHSVGNNLLTKLSNSLTNLNLTDMETGFKVFRGDLIRTIAPHLRSRNFGFEPEITARLARIPELKMYEVGISYWGRTYAEGKKINWRDGIRALGSIVYYNLWKNS